MSSSFPSEATGKTPHRVKGLVPRLQFVQSIGGRAAVLVHSPSGGSWFCSIFSIHREVLHACSCATTARRLGSDRSAREASVAFRRSPAAHAGRRLFQH